MLGDAHPGFGVVHRRRDLADIETAVDTQHQDIALIRSEVSDQQLRGFGSGEARQGFGLGIVASWLILLLVQGNDGAPPAAAAKVIDQTSPPEREEPRPEASFVTGELADLRRHRDPYVRGEILPLARQPGDEEASEPGLNSR